MGQKIHPGGLRVGVIHDWKSNWYTGKKEFAGYILEDVKIREHIYGKLAHAGLSDILIRKDKQRITVDIYTARPGIVIGKSGVEVDALRKELHALTQKNVHININEIKRPELDAKLVAQSIAEQLSNRVAFRRAMKRALASAIRSGAAGVKIRCAGRLGGGEMSRSETYSEGRVPLHTIRADIDYGFVEAKTSAGRIGVKVWINKGEIMPEGFGESDSSRLGDQDARRRRGGALEGLGASRESGRTRGQDREGLGPVRQRRRGPGGGGPGGPGGRPGQRRGPGSSGARPAGGAGSSGARPAGGAGGGRGPRRDQPVEQPRADETQVQATEPVVETPAPEQIVETPVVEAVETPTTEAPAVEAPVEETPKRAPRKKAEPKAEAEAEEKPKRAPRKKAEPTADAPETAEPKDGDA
jgi:small subunit ribosomal protein S3